MRRMLVSRSSFEKPSPLERLVRTSSPSSSSTRYPRSRKMRTRFSDKVDLPAPERPVNQRMKPLCIMFPFGVESLESRVESDYLRPAALDSRLQTLDSLLT